MIYYYKVSQARFILLVYSMSAPTTVKCILLFYMRVTHAIVIKTGKLYIIIYIIYYTFKSSFMITVNNTNIIL